MLKIFSISCRNAPYATFLRTLVQIQYGTYNSIYYVINYLHPILDTSFDLCGWRTSTIISLEVFYCKLKRCYLTCIAGGLLKDCPTRKSFLLHIAKSCFLCPPLQNVNILVLLTIGIPSSYRRGTLWQDYHF